MNLKQLFQDNKKSEKITEEQINQEVRSEGYTEELVKNTNTFIPQVDFSNPSEFAFFGSAKKYYEESFSRILNLYPYDGSKTEKLKWYNESTLLDKWVFDKKYPKFNGYAKFSANGWGTRSGSKVSGYGLPSTQEYIYFSGGPNTGTINLDSSPLSDVFKYANIYDSTNNQTNNLLLNPSLSENGITIEFWLKKEAFNNSNTEKEVVFDIWNGADSSSAGYGRLTIELTASNGPFLLTLQSGTSGIFQQQVASTLSTGYLTSDWHHYAIAISNNTNSTQLNYKFYTDGQLLEDSDVGTSINEITGALTAQIGSLRTATSGTSTNRGYGKLNASIDEFRYWKEKRNSQQIGRNWWTNVDGGSNTDDYATSLGIYYKFNEGIVGETTKDQIVVDYSGRTTNGFWAGYTTNSRVSGSGIALYSSASYSEIGDPILYSTQTDVVYQLNELTLSGSVYDSQNSTSLYSLYPSWITEEDSVSGEELKKLTQVICSYFDTLYLQIKYLPKIKDNISTLARVQKQIEGETELNEVIGTEQTFIKPTPFANILLDSSGMVTPEILSDVTFLEKYLNRNETVNYEEKISDIKNTIYHNIYSTLIDTYKTKGTKKAYKNILHSFGIDESVVKINTYPTNTTLYFDDNRETLSEKRTVVNFNNTSNYDATVYQYTDATNSNSKSFITGSSFEAPFSIECEAIMPYKIFDEASFERSYFTESSIFGGHTANPSNDSDLTWFAADPFSFVVKSNRNSLSSVDGYFEISSSLLSSPLTSSMVYDLYKNQKWNFVVKLYPLKEENSSIVSSITGSYVFEFTAINAVSNATQNSFTLTASISNTPARAALRASKRLFVGSHRTNFTGSIVNYSDVKVSYLRYWVSNLSYETLESHAYSTYNYGTNSPAENTQFNFTSTNRGQIIPQTDTIALYWSFNQITSSDSSGQFITQDLTSGSINSSTYIDWFNDIIKYQYTGRGDFFDANSADVIDTEYFTSERLKQIDTINSSDMINILTEDDESFTTDSRPELYITRFEKSMYQAISDEILNMFSTIVEFNNHVGRPIHKYRSEYKDLRYLKEMFFSKVQNEPNLDKYLEFYKWFDSSIGIFLAQLTPATAQVSSKLENTVESHILERQKYEHRYPQINSKVSDPEAGAEGINRHLYNYKFGFRPISNNQTTNALYWKERAERNTTPLSSSNSGVNNTRVAIHSASLQVLNRKFTTPYKLETIKSRTLKGGVNFENNKKVDFVYNATAPAGALETDLVYSSSIPANYLFIGINNTASAIAPYFDSTEPTSKRKFTFKTIVGKNYSTEISYDQVLDSDISMPFNFISGTIETGYNKEVYNGFMKNVIITNLHNDVYGSDNEKPVQGPFTNEWVGGHQSRHVELNRGSDGYTTRPEAWKLLVGVGDFTGSGYQAVVGMVGADYPYPEGNPGEPSYPVVAHKKATYYRDEMVKRPVNIKNINTSFASNRIGNYRSNYEVLHTFGRTNNDRELVDAIDPSIQTELSGILRTNTTTGRIDFTLPTRQILKTVIGSRFSAPGGYRYSSRGYLNRYAEEYSPYNAISFRNREVIGSPHGLGSTPNVEVVSGALGTGSLIALSVNSRYGYANGGSRPSFHKVNRNAVYSVTSDSYTLEADYDNGFITHQIPQNDAGYSWIRDSLSIGAVSGNLAYIGHYDQFTVPSGSTVSVIPAYVFVSSSVANSSFINELVDVDNLFLGQSSSSNITSYSGINYDRTNGELLNAILLNRNGPFGHNSWNQSRIGESILVRKMKEQSKIANTRNIRLAFRRGNPNVTIPVTNVYKEPSFISGKPIISVVRDTSNDSIIFLKHTYDNNLRYFGNKSLNTELGLPSFKQDEDQTMDRLLSYLESEANDRYELKSVILTEQVFPKTQNLSFKDTREREEFNFDYKVNQNNRETSSKAFYFNISQSNTVESITINAADITNTSSYYLGVNPTNARGFTFSPDGFQLFVAGNESGSFTTASVSFTVNTSSLTVGDKIIISQYVPDDGYYNYTLTGVYPGPSSSTPPLTFITSGSSYTSVLAAQSIRDSINNATSLTFVTASTIGSTITISTIDTGLDENNHYIQITGAIGTSGITPMTPTYAMFTGGNGDVNGPYDIEQYELARPWDITSIGARTGINLNFSSSFTGNIGDVKLSQDGTNLYITFDRAASVTSYVYQYSLATPYDTTTMNPLPFAVITSSIESQIEGITFQPNGLSYYLVGNGANKVIRHKVSTPWSIAPIQTVTTSSVINSLDPYSICFNNSGTIAYLFGKKLDSTGGRLASYNLTSPYDITTLSLTTVLTSTIDDIFDGYYTNNVIHGAFMYLDTREPKTYILDDNQNIITLDGPNTLSLDSTNINKSIWPLDGALINNINATVGVLQNNNTYVSASTATLNTSLDEYLSYYENVNKQYPAPLYAMKGLSYSYYSNLAPTLPDASKLNVYLSSSLNARFIRRLNTGSLAGRISSVLSDEQLYYNTTIWTAAHLRGKGPYLDNYSDFNETSKLKNKEYGLIPEFTISDKVESYNNNRLKANLGFTDSSYLTITGTAMTNSDAEGFFERYSHSNNIEIIKNVNDKISATNNRFKKKLTLSFEGMKKFVPYNGFYPVQRTVDIANQFSSSYILKSNFYSQAFSENNTPSSGSIYSQTYATSAYFEESPQYGLRSLITPLFAPGILYNTIKSGLAVDFPILTSSMISYGIFSNPYANGNQMPLIANQYFDTRLPFETIITPEKYMKNIDIIDQVPSVGPILTDTWDFNLNITSSIDDKNNSLYSYMINNFLAEVPNFFLADQKLSSLNSNIVVGSSIQITPQDLNKEFTAIVKIKKTFEEKGNKEKLTRRALSVYSSSVPMSEAFLELQKDKYNYPRPQKIYDRETITLYSNPSAFGFPVMNVGFDNGGSGEYWAFNLIDSISGFYPSYTPSYYDGEGWMILRYKPTTTGSYSLSDIINRTTASYLRYEIDQQIEQDAPAPTSEYFFYSHNITSSFASSINYTGSYALTANGTAITDKLNLNSMQFSASAFMKVDKVLPNLNDSRFTQGSSQLSIADRERLVISTKFETPILDFEYSRLINELSCTHNDVFYGTSDPSAITNSSPKNLGMWHQYGLLPKDNTGIYLEIMDMPESYKKRGRQTSIVLTGSVFNINRNTTNTGSFIDLIGGFENSSTRIGDLAESKEIKEAVVAIPFTTVNNKKKYFKIKNEIVKNYKDGKTENISPTLLTQFNAMKEYIFPPQFDFLAKKSVEKIAMYVFEFTHTLSKQDLQDIWQNIMPELGEPQSWKIETKTIEHELLEDEILSSIDDVDNIRWMVFKVKKRAAGSYKEMVGKNFANKASWIDTDIPEYTYNWPYDFFTMIENGKLTVSLQIEKDDTRPNLSGQLLPEFPTGG